MKSSFLCYLLFKNIFPSSERNIALPILKKTESIDVILKLPSGVSVPYWLSHLLLFISLFTQLIS